MHMNVKVLNSNSRRYSVLNHKVFMVCAFLTPTLLNGICMFTVVSRSQRGIGEEVPCQILHVDKNLRRPPKIQIYCVKQILLSSSLIGAENKT